MKDKIKNILLLSINVSCEVRYEDVALWEMQIHVLQFDLEQYISLLQQFWSFDVFKFKSHKSFSKTKNF